MSTAAIAATPILEPVDYDPFAGGALERVVPTTRAQREIWLADQLGQDASLAFNLAVRLRFHGELDVDALRQALQDLADRHDALRANVAPDGLELCIRSSAPLPVEYFDFAGFGPVDAGAAVSERFDRAVQTPFSLAVDPLFRAELMRIGAGEHVLLLAAHHVVCDGWSWWVIVRELGALYGQHLARREPQLPEPATFGDFCLDEAESYEPSKREADEAYWQGRFPGAATVLELPADRTRPPVRSFASAWVDHVLDEDLLCALRHVGARRNASLFAMLLAGFSGLLSRLTGQSDIVIGIPAAGQPVAGCDDLVGHCVNTLPLRFDVDASDAFSKLLDVAQGTLLDALDHQQCTLGTLLTRLRLPRDPARMPLVSVLFNLDQAIDQQSEAFEGLAMEFDSVPRTFETFELFVNAVQAKGQLRLECQYNTDLFDAATIRRWLRAYECLLRGAVESLSTELRRLPMLDAETRSELGQLQPGPVEYDYACRVHEYFERQCDRTPMRRAVLAGGTGCSYQDLEARANQIAHVLREHGIGRGALVGVAIGRGVDMLAALLAILKSGAGYVPLDPAFPTERLAFMAADAGLAMLVTTREHADRVDLRGRPVLLLDADSGRIHDASAQRLGPDADCASPEDPAYVIYTSGSTGRPKGVVVPHRAVSNFLSSMRASPGLSEHDRLVAVTTLSFDIAVLELLLPLSVGAEVIVADRDTASDGQALRALVESSNATVMQGTPSSWRLLLEAGWKGSSAFKALCGGEPMAPDLAASLLSRCGSVWNLYGPTETTVWSTCAHIERRGDGAMPDVHIGRPITNTSIWIVDGGGELCPLGVPGEICIGGHGVTRGYLDRPELTSARFIPDRYTFAESNDLHPVVPAWLYRTGDRGRWRKDGNLEHMGRLDNQVKVRGYRIELGEIEANLCACTGIARVAAIVREDRPDDLRLVAYVVPLPGTVLDEAALKNQLQGVLPAYMLPQHIVVLDGLPELPNGKIDRNGLPPPLAKASAPAAKVEAPATGIDPRVRYLSGLWSELLGVPASAEDNFFELGGHSMLAVQMASRVQRDTGHRIKLISLGAETLCQVASRLPMPDSSGGSNAGVGGRIGSGLRRLLGMDKADQEAR